MTVLIVGCAQVGAALAARLYRAGHDIVIIDREEESFDLLPNDFRGYTLCGIPTDGDVLKKGGVEDCDILIAITSDDAVNLMVGQIAKKVFHVPQVLVRVSDPERQAAFADSDLILFSPSSLVVNTAMSFFDLGCDIVHTLPFGGVDLSLRSVAMPEQYVGKTVAAIKTDLNEQIIGVQQKNEILLLRHLTDVPLRREDRLIIVEAQKRRGEGSVCEY